VLEVGAGCGAITRLLGECCALVDAVEPVAERARATRLRTRDLTSVEVFVGGLADVPRVDAYDIVIVTGVLEYAGHGTADLTPYREFLAHLHDVLRPGGTLVLAIENRLGVKYIAGAPEDHSGRVYESVEGYRNLDAPARTFSRRELTSLMTDAGFMSQTLGAFPDYKFTRMVYSDALLAEHPELAWRIPMFPSPELNAERAHAISEGPLWRELVRSGVAAEFPNSLVVVASRGAATHELWPESRLAVFYQPSRRARYVTQTSVERDGGTARFVRRNVAPGPANGGVHHVLSDEPLVPGVELMELMESAGDDELARLVESWAMLVRELTERESSPASIDCGPTNVICGPGGEMRFIDVEWRHDDYDVEAVLARGALWGGMTLAMRTPAERWRGSTIEDVVVMLGRLAGLGDSSTWLASAIERESALQAEVSLPPADMSPEEDEAAAHARQVRATLATRLRDLPLGERAHQRLAQARNEVAELQAERAALEARTAERDHLLEMLEGVVGSTSWRATRPLRVVSRTARRVLH
jgi:SAM-dependent methyltransferase